MWSMYYDRAREVARERQREAAEARRAPSRDRRDASRALWGRVARLTARR